MAEGEVPPFAPRPGEYVYAEVAGHLAAQIGSGRIPVGARLAGERELMEMYGIALGTARRAVQELRDRGLVKTLPSKGTFVVAQEPDED